MTPLAIPGFILMLALMQVASDWYRSRDIDVLEGDLMNRRLVSWGTVRALSGNSELDFRYFNVTIPYVRSWEMDDSNREFCWHELLVSKFAGEWRSFWVPTYP